MSKTIQFPPSSYLVTYYQTLYENIWLLRQEKLNKRQVLWKIQKKEKFGRLDC